MSIQATRYFSLDDVERYNWSFENREHLSVTRSTTARLTLAAAIELASLRHADVEMGEDRQLLSAFSHCPNWCLLNQLNWPYCGHRQRAERDGTTFISLPATGADAFWDNCLREFEVRLRTKGFPARLSRSLTGALGEMVDNVWQHSETRVPGLVGYQIEHRKLSFGVSDLGIGVLDSLRRNLRYRGLVSSMEALETAIIAGVTRHESGGYGFSTLFESIAELWGISRLRSGEAAVAFDRRLEQRRRKRYYLPACRGFRVLVACRLDPARTE